MILITGGTGFVGHDVVTELLALGHRVRLLVRDPARAASLAHHPQVELVQGDALRPETLFAAMTGVKEVIHLIGIIAETSKISFEEAHVEATRNVLNAAKDAGVIRWIQMSACGTRAEANSRYHLTKWQAEELVRRSGFDWTIFRPSLIYGYDRRDRLLNLFRRLLTRPVASLLLDSFPLLNGGRPLVQPVSVGEVALCFARALRKEASFGRTYALVGPVAFTWREMVGKIAAHFGRSTVYEGVPLLLVVRGFLWLAVLLLPVLFVVALEMNELATMPVVWGTVLWLVLTVVAGYWRTVVLFNVPAGPLLAAAGMLNAFLPRAFQMSEQLKMAVEDNTGDPRPAMEVFEYVPETFEQGLMNLR